MTQHEKFNLIVVASSVLLALPSLYFLLLERQHYPAAFTALIRSVLIASLIFIGASVVADLLFAGMAYLIAIVAALLAFEWFLVATYFKAKKLELNPQ